MTWRVIWEKSAADELERLGRGNPSLARRVGRAVTRLAETGQGNVKRLQGYEREWRLRVGDWRVRFERNSATQTITILSVLPRGRAYRG